MASTARAGRNHERVFGARQQPAASRVRGYPETRESDHPISRGREATRGLEKRREIRPVGYGLRFTDYPPRNPNGGNCYACHQLTKQEVSYGTIGPSLLGYGKLREFTPEAIKAAYEKIYNPHATFACSLMPRFGSNQVLTMHQIKDLVALLMDRESPVNRD